MNKKIILVILFGILISITGIYFILEDNWSNKQNEKIHNHPSVKNCVPALDDEAVIAIGISNSTHSFDLRNCIWSLK